MVLAPLMIELSVWIIAFGVLIFCILSVYIAKALFGVAGGRIGKLPIVGGWINSGLHSVEHKIVSVMSAAAAGAESICGAALHVIARQIDWIGREIKSHSNLLAALALLSLGVVDFKALAKELRGVRTQVHGATGTIARANHRIDAAEKRLAHGIGEDVLPRVKSLEREVHGVIARDIPSIRAGTRTAEREITNLWKWTRHHTLAAGTLAFAGAVSLALSRLGLGWLRCNSLSKLGKRIGCSGFGALEEILFAVGEALVVTDLCQFAAAAETVALQLQPLLIELVDVENALVGCHGATAPPDLALLYANAPPSIRSLPLAA